MWILYVGLGLLLLFIIFCIFVGFMLTRVYAWPKLTTYEKMKEWLINHNTYEYYEKTDKIDYKIVLKSGYELNARLLKCPIKESNKYIIMAHGYTANQIIDAKYIDIYHRLGYNVVTYDERGHHNNVKTKCTMGILESKDLIEVIDDAYNRYGKDIFLGIQGESMGAATVITSMRYKPNVKFVMEDCGYNSLLDLSIYSAKTLFHLPKFFVYFAKPISKIFYKTDYLGLVTTEGINNSKAPLLICHGDEDEIVPLINAHQVYDSYDSYKEIHIFKGAKHAVCVLSDKEKYFEIVKNFLEKVENM